jgi:hypothetical protein
MELVGAAAFSLGVVTATSLIKTGMRTLARRRSAQRE